ncbi:MAG: LysM peptidoglycan-binding domain-containing protein [Bacteroidales bacterium]|nr:LysM peptidoglycan-binding domain-containing protein [Bacteroidales bacterium]
MIRYKTILPMLLMTAFSFLTIKAQETSIDEDIRRISRDLDSLVNTWYVRMAMIQSPSTDDYSGEPIPEFADSVYLDRLGRINSLITLPYNNIIRNHIHVYTSKQQDKFRIILGLQDYYFPMIEDIFGSYGLPNELKYMAVIESALNPNAVSRAGATGLWQFMYSTGRMYGLTINSVLDERRDPVKSTHAAARYLTDLYKIYNDWILVIAAYNCGPGNVNKAIARSGNRRDYWDIYYRLPRETRGYIPQFVAALYSMTYHQEHNIPPMPVNIPLAVDTIMVTRDIHLRQVAEVMGVPYNDLRALNPQYRTGLVPGRSKPAPLTLPVNYVGEFIYLHDTIENHKANVYLAKTGNTTNPASSSFSPPEIQGKTKLVYTVKSGDNLGYIAQWYNLPLSDIRYWNNIYRNTIYVGQKITLYVDPQKADHYARVNTMSFAEKQKQAGKPVPVNVVPATTSPAGATEDVEYEYYVVRSGDTVWDIAKKFDGVTFTDILALNNLTDSGKIRVGQRLKIRKKV